MRTPDEIARRFVELPEMRRQHVLAQLKLTGGAPKARRREGETELRRALYTWITAEFVRRPSLPFEMREQIRKVAGEAQA